MKKQNKQFYEETYRMGRLSPAPTGFLWKIFFLLRHFELHRREAVFELLEPRKRLLDIGCGDGSLMVLARKEKFQEVYGIDIAEKSLCLARKNLKKELKTTKGFVLKRADVDEKIPFPNNFFDSLTAVAVLEHVFDPYFVVGEIKRVLKPKGIFILEVPNIAWLPYRISLLFGKLPKTSYGQGWDGGHLHYFTFEEVRNLLERNGFRILEETTSGIFTQFRKIYPSLLGANIIIKAQKK